MKRSFPRHCEGFGPKQSRSGVHSAGFWIAAAAKAAAR